jgi:hypothetical protein
MRLAPSSRFVQKSTGDSELPMSLVHQRDLFLSEPEPEVFEGQSDANRGNEPEKIRLKLNALLEQARAAKLMPWPERDARMWQIVFPQMANWLPPDEAAQLRRQFAQEMQRLTKAA